ncbi:WYL domain-containing protein [Microbacterium sp. LRZ72]|uniref:helix-turn-helix transcriptional regulator n=1 Tax=Microbacterium sp. LRZ72 TaxID=2942481 RepID=UPI0029B0D78F|nr:WYL domain-containing protein [Microbacterium sp. LRZ72]MDX2375307.1 WYL domain-containing protein [Microbacterium sp. LRZ72]
MTTRSLLAIDRVALVMNLVPYLVEKGPVPVTEAAREFDVDPDVLRRLAEGLVVIGLPEGMHHELFDIDWDLLDERDELQLLNTVAFERAPRLTAREAAALLAGLQLAQSAPGIRGSSIVPGLIAKLARGASDAPGELVVASDAADGVRTTLMEALDQGVAVSFTHQKPDAAPTTRTVDPVRILVEDDQWYLRGWCHLRRDMRTFHLDRISEATVTDIPAAAHDDPGETVFARADGALEAVIEFDPHVAPLLGQYLDYAEVSESGDRRRAVLRVADPPQLKRLAARRGGSVAVVSPSEARDAARAWARAGLAQYG